MAKADTPVVFVNEDYSVVDDTSGLRVNFDLAGCVSVGRRDLLGGRWFCCIGLGVEGGPFAGKAVYVPLDAASEKRLGLKSYADDDYEYAI